MKTRIIISIVLFAVIVAALPVFAAPISPALDIIAYRLKMAKATVSGGEVAFDKVDFDDALGVKVSRIEAVSLPSAASGKIYIGDDPISVGQIVARKSFDRLRFVPSGMLTGDEDCSSFVFRNVSDSAPYEVECMLYITSEPNFAPTVAPINDSCFKISTYRDIACYSVMRALDPDNDALRFELTDYPNKGVIEYDPESGAYHYTPISGFTGKDGFKYEAFDKYGNSTGEVNVKITVEKPDSSVVFADMNGHWGLNSALRMTKAGIMSGETDGGLTVFSPDKAVSRAEFLTMAMMAGGYTVRGNAVNTSFEDNGDIPDEYRGYVAAAGELGFISGTQSGAGYIFRPNDDITRAEASVMLNNILSIPASGIRPVFADETAVPAWAEDAIYALSEAGILNGTGGGNISPFTVMTRAACAEMLSGACNYLG